MNYHPHMEFEWDEDKSDRCFFERGFDFAYALRAFLDANRLVISARKASRREVKEYEDSSRQS